MAGSRRRSSAGTGSGSGYAVAPIPATLRHPTGCLPGIGPAGQRWCTACAGGIGDDNHPLIEQRQEAFRPRFGTEMSGDNVWLPSRHQEITSLQRTLLAIDQAPPTMGVRGAGATDRMELGHD
jgi:hypothetical protein